MKQRKNNKGQKDEFLGRTMTSMTPSMIWMGSKSLKLSNESKIAQFGVQKKKKIGPHKVKGGFSKTQHASPLKFCAFSVNLMAFNDFKLNIYRFYSLLAFRRDQNHRIWRSDERVMIVWSQKVFSTMKVFVEMKVPSPW